MTRSIALAAALLTPSLALAQTASLHPGSLILSADRLMPLLSVATQTSGSDPTQSKQTITSVSLLGNPIGFATSYYNLPRLGFDYLTGAGVTLGLDATLFFTLSASRQSSGSTQSTDEDKITVILLNPRVGYVAPVSPTVSLWPRIGITYSAITDSPPSSATGANSVTQSVVGLNLEALAIITPVEHVGITLGPVVDIPVGGSTGGSTSRDLRHLQFGIMGGLSFWF